MERKEEIEVLEKELADNLRKSVELSRNRLDEDLLIIEKQTRDQIEIYSNDIRNISIISGTVAPFSLTLLEIEQLGADPFLLIIGFSILLLNIVASQYFVRKHSTESNTKLVKANFNWLMAEFELSDMANEDLDSNQRIQKYFDYLKSIGESEKLLGIGTFNIEIQKVRSIVKRHYKITNLIFSIGSICIVLSVILSPLVNSISSFMRFADTIFALWIN